MRCIQKQLFASVSVKVMDIYLHFGEQLLIIGHYFPKRREEFKEGKQSRSGHFKSFY